MEDDYYSRQKVRTYAQLSKQELKKLQDQEYSYNIMCILLNSLEGYAISKKEKRKYGGYDDLNSVETKNKLQLKKQLIFHLRRMKDSYELFVEDHGSYELPKKMPKSQIISDVQKWIPKVPPEDQKYYYAFIDLLNGKDIPDFKSDLNSIPSTVQKGENHAYNLMEGMIKINYHAGKKEKNVQDNYETKGYHEFEPNLYGQPQSNPYLAELSKKGKKEEEKEEIIVGENGKLIPHENNLYYINDKNVQKKLNLDWKIIQPQCFYNTYYGIIHINQIYKDGSADCSLFNSNNVKKIDKKFIKILGNTKTDFSSYDYGIAEINGKKVNILVDLLKIC